MKLLSALKATKKRLKRQVKKAATMAGEDCWLFVPEYTKGRVCIVAHIDTVWDETDAWDDYRYLGCQEIFLTRKKPKLKKKAPSRSKRIFFDKEQGILWSPDGLGADDRAGVYAALKLFRETPEPYKPLVLLTDHEETGGRGAREASVLFADVLSECNFIIELDRANGEDAVFYNDEPQSFVEYIESFGFKESSGSFSDISTICPGVKRCGANLSVGYYNQHTSSEFLDINKMNETLEKTRRMLVDNHEKGKVWELEDALPDFYEMMDTYYEMEDESECPRCQSIIYEDELTCSQGYCPICGAHIGYLSDVEERLAEMMLRANIDRP